MKTMMKIPASKARKGRGGYRLPVTTLTQARVPVFAATRGMIAEDEPYTASSPYGTVSVRGGALTQRQRDILDVLFAFNEPVKSRAGRIGYLFEAYGFLRHLGYDHPGERDVEWLKDQFEQIMERVIAIRSEGGDAWHAFHIIGEATASKQKILAREREQNRWLMAVTISASYVAVLGRDMHLSFTPLVEKIVSLKHDLNKAIVRTMLSHSSRHRRLDDMLRDLGIEPNRLSERTRRKYRHCVVSEAEALKRGFGIEVVEDGPFLKGVRLDYEEHANVYTTRPENSETLAALTGPSAPEPAA
jgi:hypothetical protein